jgi:hypothetical protein
MTFASDKTYITGSVVNYNGTLYQAIQQTYGNLPTNTSYWNIVTNFNDSKPTYITNGIGTSILVNSGQTIKQGKLFTNIGESLQTSNTQQAKFIREL